MCHPTPKYWDVLKNPNKEKDFYLEDSFGLLFNLETTELDNPWDKDLSISDLKEIDNFEDERVFIHPDPEIGEIYIYKDGELIGTDVTGIVEEDVDRENLEKIGEYSSE